MNSSNIERPEGTSTADQGTVDASAEARAAVKWQRADDGLWVAHFHGRFGGTVDRHRRRFAALDPAGRSIGEFRSLELAKHELSVYIAEHDAA